MQKKQQKHSKNKHKGPILRCQIVQRCGMASPKATTFKNLLSMLFEKLQQYYQPHLPSDSRA